MPANIPPIAVSSLPSNAAASSGNGTPRSRQVVMEDLRALKASLDAGDVDQVCFLLFFKKRNIFFIFQRSK